MSRVRIAIVANEMEGAPTGVGTYLQGLLLGLAALPESQVAGFRFLLFFKGDPFDHPLWNGSAEEQQMESGLFEPYFDCRVASRTVLWEQLRLPRLLAKARPDLLFSPNYSLPGRGPWPSVVALHDLSFEHLPEEFTARERWRRRLLARRAARRASRLLIATETMAKDLESTYGVPAERIGRIPLAVQERFHPPMQSDDAKCDQEQLAALGLESPYILFLGSIFERRRPGVLIRAFAEIATEFPQLHLALAGHNRLRQPESLDREIQQASLDAKVHCLGYVADDALPALYRRALLACYLSTYEGYGIPPLEALASGTAVVVSPGQALDDLWPDYPYRCEAWDQPALVQILRRALLNDEERQALEKAGPGRIRQLSWQLSAQALLREFAKCLPASSGQPTGAAG